MTEKAQNILDINIDPQFALSAQDVQFVLDLSIKAGAIAVAMRSGATVEEKTSASDLVTSADKALSELIVKALQERFPADLVLSEEAPWVSADDGRRRWIIDPIDGTKFYVDNTGKYCVMIGLEHKGRALFGCFYMPAHKQALLGGPGMGAYRYSNVDEHGQGILAPAKQALVALPSGRPVKVLVSKNDMAANGWLGELPGVEIVTASSIGIDVFELSENLADVFVKVRPTLGYWDTAAPGPVAQAMGFEVGTETDDFIAYGYEAPRHACNVVIGSPGALAWWRSTLAARAAATAPAAAPAAPPQTGSEKK